MRRIREVLRLYLQYCLRRQRVHDLSHGLFG